MTLFARQSVLAKSLLTLLTLVAGVLSTLPQCLALHALALLCILAQPSLLIDWLRLLARLTPLFVALLLFGWLAGAPFPTQALILARISLLLVASVWLARTSRLEDLVSELHPLRRVSFVHDGLWYLVGTLLWLPVIGDELRQRREGTSWRATPRLLVDAFASAMERMDEIETRTEQALAHGDRARRFSAANLLLLAPAAAGAAMLYLL